ncbi:WRKY transcription factor 22-like [Gastrolobium bilobum]|uniref:WRKY transcription factor 22-like n=1 Tax=Gastrolobium bilobum TaxID=150636 RepID=UPI002AB19A75|nr:WRKY transcription factor 22-like [Gastrolobium bilobum]
MDWDLQAIVGCISEAPATTMDTPHLSFSHFCCEQGDLLCNFQEFSETTTVVDELEELYKPLSISTISLPIPEETEEVKVPSNKVAVQDLRDPAASKCCKRSDKFSKKNKRVKYVTAADGVSDPWAWRKYGQKPIKGSPYPRSYYRCSSYKGCLARKLVERSHLDPEVFIVTYTAEHSHPHPTRKNPRAGNKQKKNSSIIAPPSTHDQNTFTPNSTAVLLFPRTSPVVVESIEEVLEQSKVLKKEEDFVDGDGWFPSIELARETKWT